MLILAGCAEAALRPHAAGEIACPDAPCGHLPKPTAAPSDVCRIQQLCKVSADMGHFIKTDHDTGNTVEQIKSIRRHISTRKIRLILSQPLIERVRATMLDRVEHQQCRIQYG